MSADVIEHVIEGDFSQMLTITLDPGEAVQAEAGTMVLMDPDIEMTTEMPGGFFGAIMRKVSGESLFLTFFANTGSRRQDVSFASPHDRTDQGSRSEGRRWGVLLSTPRLSRQRPGRERDHSFDQASDLRSVRR